MPRRNPIVVDELLTKATSSALLAVEMYNKPTAEFRIQAFVILMHIAWNSLLLAVFHKRRLQPFYKERNGYNYVKVDGDRKAWGLSDCIRRYWGSAYDAVRANLTFILQLRNKIEHYRDQAILGRLTFGECQSLVTNFDEIVVGEFGQQHSLADQLSLSIQLSLMKDSRRDDAVLASVDKSTCNLREFINDFRSSLDDDVYSDMRFSHKLFLLPRTANHQSRDSLAIEWIDVDGLPQKDLQNIERLFAIIKQKRVPVFNMGLMKPKAVSEKVKEALGLEEFAPSHHHVRCWRYFKVRPEQGDGDPYSCDPKYCYYDELSQSYGYTQEWVGFLEEQLSDPSKFREIMDYRGD